MDPNTPSERIRRAQELAAPFLQGGSAVDDFIAWKREEARREEEEFAAAPDPLGLPNLTARERARRVQELLAPYLRGPSMADELIAERREEARKESAD